MTNVDGSFLFSRLLLLIISFNIFQVFLQLDLLRLIRNK
jgi:hypothetical protein